MLVGRIFFVMEVAMDLEKIMVLMKQEGFFPKLNEDNCIQFKYEGGNYFIESFEDDVGFIRIVYAYFWPIESEEERIRALTSANEVTKGIKVVKVYVINNDVWASTELLFNNEEEFCSFIMRCLDAISVAVRRFKELMHESLRDSSSEIESITLN